MRKVIASALIAGSLAGGLALAAPASATPMPEVCQGIDDAPTYRSYIVQSWALGVAVHANQRQQVQNIVDSIRVYCPQHMPGILAAADSLSS